MPKFGLEIMPWCPRCETWHGSDEDHWDEIETANAES
jgi:hypothetical protein